MTESVSELHYIALAVPDLAAERTFFADSWGLTEVASKGDVVYFAAQGATQPFVISLRQDAQRKTDLISFAARSREGLERLHRQVQQARCRMICDPGPAATPGGGFGFRFFDPDGRAIEIITESAARPARKLDKGEAIPLGLSHIVLHSPDLKALAKFYADVLGFRISDWIGEFMVFLRCNRAHHRLAILPGPPALNHIAFDVSSIDELMRGLARLMSCGVTLSWGPGRHTAGNNAFTYYLTPNGNAVEYTSDLEEVDEATWQPTTYAFSPAITDLWGTGRIIPGNVPHAELSADKGLWQVPA
jgi:2,3-dihydroxy-p-cumate/2,3-dihydroxybenzoate 3,4-dioxygenase